MLEKLYIVIPCYNEQEVLEETAKRLASLYDNLIHDEWINKESKIVFVNDGSNDRTWDIVVKLSNENSYFAGINLSRNVGHQNALLAGLMTVKQFADVTISMDADLQDDIYAIKDFLKKYNTGADIVYGVRNSRKTDTFFKKFTGEGFYKVMKALGTEIIYNHADYRLMSQRALNGLAEFKEVNLFLRGIVPLIGYKTDIVYYARHERYAGKSKYPLRKMLALAFEGVSSMSTKLIRIITFLGLTLFVVSICMLMHFFILYFSGKEIEPGWSSLFVSVWALGGLQLLSIGIVGEYIGKIYLETKARPRFIVERVLNLTRDDK